MAKKPDIYAQWAKLGGPLPARGAGSASSAFWRAYNLGPSQQGLRGGVKGSLAERAFRAGLKRRKVESGLSPRTPT